jgi:hypothetical protein
VDTWPGWVVTSIGRYEAEQIGGIRRGAHDVRALEEHENEQEHKLLEGENNDRASTTMLSTNLYAYTAP